MSRPWIAGDHHQPALLPVDARDLLGAEHLSARIEAMVAELDLSAFEAAYRRDGRGRPPFHPRVMLGLILYCRAKGHGSGRAIAAACHDDLGARAITGNRYPDRSTIDRFLEMHQAAIKGLLAQTLRLGHVEGLVDLNVVAGDGTCVQANAALDANLDQTKLQAQIAELEQQLADAQRSWAAQIDTEAVAAATLEGLFDVGQGTPGQGTPSRQGSAAAARRRVSTLSNLLTNRKAALAYLHAHPSRTLTGWADKLARDKQRVERALARVEQITAQVAAANQRRAQAKAAGRGTGGRPPVPPEQHSTVRRAKKLLQTATERLQTTAATAPTAKVNTTDPTSLIMPGKKDGYDQRYHVQALACANQFIIAIATHPSTNTNDEHALTGLLSHARANLDAAGITTGIGVALFDAGYASQANFTAELPCELLLVSVEKEARQTGRLQDGTSTAAASWQTMAERLNDPHHRSLYKRRAAIIEPLFAQLFTRFGRWVQRRGEHVDTELHLWAVTHNLLKINRRRQRNHPGG